MRNEADLSTFFPGLALERGHLPKRPSHAYLGDDLGLFGETMVIFLGVFGETIGPVWGDDLLSE